jgi:hypothetical protein
MCQHVAVERVEGGIVDIRLQDAFAQIVEHDQASDSAEPAKGLLVQLGPDSSAGGEGEQTNAFTAVAESQYEQPAAPVLASMRVAHQGPVAIIDLCFFVMERVP